MESLIYIGSAYKSGCRFELKHASGESPLIIDNNKVFSPYQDATTKKWYYEANSGSSFRARCSDSRNYIGVFEENEMEVQCVIGSVIRVSIKFKNGFSLCS